MITGAGYEVTAVTAGGQTGVPVEEFAGGGPVTGPHVVGAVQQVGGLLQSLTLLQGTGARPAQLSLPLGSGHTHFVGVQLLLVMSVEFSCLLTDEMFSFDGGNIV